MIGRKTNRRRNKALTVLYCFMGFLALGYFPTIFLRENFGPQLSMIVVAVAIIPFGAKAGSVLSGLGRGAALGLVGGAALPIALLQRFAIPPDQIERTTALYTLATAMLCTAVAGLFAHMAKRRRERIDAEWR